MYSHFAKPEVNHTMFQHMKTTLFIIVLIITTMGAQGQGVGSMYDDAIYILKDKQKRGDIIDLQLRSLEKSEMIIVMYANRKTQAFFFDNKTNKCESTIRSLSKVEINDIVVKMNTDFVKATDSLWVTKENGDVITYKLSFDKETNEYSLSKFISNIKDPQ